MATIERRAPFATLINVFTVAPERAAELAGMLDDATDKVMRHVPGFISMLADSAVREHMAPAAALAIDVDPHLYTVESVHGR
jgi:hypothetical protein